MTDLSKYPVDLRDLAKEVHAELDRIMVYWKSNAVDWKQGGFKGRIDESNKWDITAAKGTVLNTRILWSFSAVAIAYPDPQLLDLADRAYQYIVDFLEDKKSGGLFWSVDAAGHALETHKQIYTQAFGIYGFSEYFKLTGRKEALEKAKTLYGLIERYSSDPVNGGYIDAFSRDWDFLDDKRLSEKDENASKTMNTHLHLVEAYANLFLVWPDKGLKDRITEILRIFDEHIIDKNSFHLKLFFSENWVQTDQIISYGHDIEAAWLLQHCAETIQDNTLIRLFKHFAVQITRAASQGLDRDGGLWYEKDQGTMEMVYEKHWWPQAEALIGFCNAWHLTGNEIYKQAMVNTWHFIRMHIIDRVFGEWYWGIDKNESHMKKQDKIGIWKCPYHNTRACLEILNRLVSENKI